uniref:Uncharacterized protein n=1 Tax=Lepeophtheirus salmonis TaxID=72036 RepID=A0A0K2TK27_LEPSM
MDFNSITSWFTWYILSKGTTTSKGNQHFIYGHVFGWNVIIFAVIHKFFKHLPNGSKFIMFFLFVLTLLFPKT